MTEKDINSVMLNIRGAVWYKAWEKIKKQFGNQIKIQVYDQLYDQCHIIISSIRTQLLNALVENKFSKSA